jgi:hypothetical protein
MDSIIIDSVPFIIDEELLRAGLKVRAGSSMAAKLSQMIGSALDIAKPKAAFRFMDITGCEEDFIVLEGMKLNSRVLAVNLKDSPNLAVFAATCGTELEEWASQFDAYLEQFWADTIMFCALGTAMEAVNERIRKVLDAETVSTMNPGSLEDWPITEQSKLFAILKNETASIGVKLNESYLMRPLKSVSGISYASGEVFHNCQLCPRRDCPGRRAPFDDGLYEKRYKMNHLQAPSGSGDGAK